MMPSDPPPALREFIAHRSESSFRELVREHSPVVFATALRKLGGNRAAAQDVTQEVFTLLARKADKLGAVILGGWLYRQTCRRAANHVRTENRRKSRETAAMPANETTTPADALDSRLLARELDDALLALPAADRDALVLRYFEGKEYRTIGQSLGLGEEATRKRIERALERLGGSLKRRGIAASCVSLGTALEGFGAPPVPAEMVSRLTTTAFTASVSPTLLGSLVKPALAGVLATSLVSGTALALRQPAASFTNAATHKISSRDARPAGPSETLPEKPSLDQIITEIKRGTSGPSNSLSAMRLSIILGKIPFADSEAFFKLANTRLEPSEKAVTYQVLLEHWMKGNPATALDLTMTARIGEQVDGVNGTNVLLNLFTGWAQNDLGKSQEWLLTNWDNDVLKESAFQGTLRRALAAEVVIDRFSSAGIDPASEFVSQIPGLADQAAVLGSLVGMSQWHQPWFQMSNDKILLLHTRLSEFPDPIWSGKLTSQFWKSLGTDRPDVVQELLPDMTPQDRFKVSLGLLAVKARPSGTTPAFNGGIIVHFEPVNDGSEREQAAMDAGIAAGLTRAESLSAIGSVLCGNSGFFDWFDAHHDELAMDDTLAEFTRKEANSSAWSTGNEMIAMEWARRISDPDLRLSLARGVFRKALARFPDAAVEYLNKTELPDDVAAELHSILRSAP